MTEKHDGLGDAYLTDLAIEIERGEPRDGSVEAAIEREAAHEGGTTEAYARAIRRWVSGEWTNEVVAVA